MQSTFHDNLSLWHRFAPKAAVMLPYVDHSSLSFSKTQKQEVNLEKKEDNFTSTYHSSLGAIEESDQWFASLNLKDIEILYVFGIGLGYAYESAKKWLNEDNKRHLIFLEDDLKVIYKFFEIERAHDILTDPQVQLIYFSDLNEESSLTELFWQFMSIKIAVSALPFYENSRNEFYQQLKHKLFYDATLRNAVTEEYLTYGTVFFHNFYHNILKLPGASLGNAMENSFQDVPAIICGAGPSLSKHFEILSNLGHKALIFAGGSSMNALNSAGIQPHLGAGIDPNPEQCKRLESNFAYEVPYLYRNRMYYDAFNKIHGPHIYVTGSGGYDISEWFDQQLNIDGKEINEGFNVVNFCVDIARLWGCNPIIFVGMDLAYTDLQAYATGVITDAKVDLDGFLNKSDIDERPIIRNDIYGKPTYTLWKWINESQWITDFASDHPEMKLINATEGGIGFHGVENVSLKDLVNKYLFREMDLHTRLHGEIENHFLVQVDQEKIASSFELLEESLKRTIDHLTILIDEAKKMITYVENTHELPQISQSGLAALAETELSEEVAYRYILEVFNIVYSKKLNYEMQNIAHEQEWELALEKWRLNIRRLSFLRDVSRANLILILNSTQRSKDAKITK